jgi:hypothetical protein
MRRPKGPVVQVMFEPCMGQWSCLSHVLSQQKSHIFPLPFVEAKTRSCLSNFQTRFSWFSGWLLSGRETTLISGFLVNYTKLSNSRFEAIWNGYSTPFYICSWQSPFVHSHAVLLTVTELATSLLMKIFVFGINVENTE